MRYLLGCFLVVLFFSCKSDKSKGNNIEEVEPKTLKIGKYRVTIDVQDNKKLPFILEVKSNSKLVVYNAEETIEIDDFDVDEDTVTIHMPIFDARIKAKLSDDLVLKGYYEKGGKEDVPLSMVFNNSERFGKSSSPDKLNGKWEVTFSPGTENEYKAKGVFKPFIGNTIKGTFLTNTGDYRFLEGVINNNRFELSCFDGAHAFLFDGEIKGDSIVNGMFYSGKHYKEPWVAVRNSNFEMLDPNTLTYLKEGYDKIEFSFPDLEGNIVSLSDSRFKDKAVIIQIMGSWCPNCLDESKFLSKFYREKKAEDLEIVALSFEGAKTMDKAVNNVTRLKNRLGIQYPILIAQYGTTNKKESAKKLPMLNHILSYPTTIFIDKSGKVQKIHTGFNGPATGQKYFDFVEDFNNTVNKLLDDKN